MTNCRWQTVPHDWRSHRESSVAKLRPRTWNSAGRRAELIPCRIIVAVGMYRIGQVVWALVYVDCEHHQYQFSAFVSNSVQIYAISALEVTTAIPDNGLQLYRTSYAVRSAFTAASGLIFTIRSYSEICNFFTPITK